MFGRLGLHLNFSVAHAKIPDSRNTQKQYMCTCMWFSYICQLTTWHYPHLLLHAMLLQCQQPLWSIDLSCLPGSKQQTHCSSCNMQRLIDETDRRTDARPLNRPCSTCYKTVAIKQLTFSISINTFTNEYVLSPDLLRQSQRTWYGVGWPALMHSSATLGSSIFMSSKN